MNKTLSLFLVFMLVVFLASRSLVLTTYANVSVYVAKQMIDANPDLVILDVRTEEEYNDGHIANAILIPVNELESRLDELDKEKDTLVYCESGDRSATASQILVDNGFSGVYYMLGGITAWKDERYSVYVKYSSIQAAINNASEGDTLFISSGTYYEHVVVNKSLSLRGENKYTTIVDGTNTGNPLTVNTSNVELTEFTMRNSSKLDPIYNEGTVGLDFYMECNNCVVTNCIISNNARGIHIFRSMNNTFCGNIIRDNWETGFDVTGYCGSNDIISNNVSENGIGIHLYFNRYSNSLSDNKITNNRYNFKVGGAMGRWPELRDFVHNIDISNTVDGKPMYYWVNEHNKQVPEDAGYVAIINSTNIVVENLSLRNNWQGVLFAYTKDSTIKKVEAMNNSYGILLYDSSHNKLIDNTLTDNDYGIQLDEHANYNIVTGNTIANNGLGTYVSIGGDNVFYHNNFINNEESAYIYAYANVWDDDYPSCGNYWSDHNPPDFYSGPYQNETGSDGVGDIPYVMDDDNKDTYPLIYPYNYVPNPDVNDDEIVDIFDVVTVAAAFGSKPGDPDWNPIADLVQDEVIDIFDIVLLANNFGKST